MDHPFSFRIPWIRMLNRWVVVVYFSLIHPILLYRRFHNGGITNSSYFWIGMALVVLALYLPQVLRDIKQATKIEFDGLVLTLGFIFKSNVIIPINAVSAVLQEKHRVMIVTDNGEIELTSQLPTSAYTLLSQLHQKFGEI
jgi:uncharacterized membrane protein YdbT with pleckstrin-like domain